ncbi:hypothetical protein B0H10DRAFT_2167613 [Mycena sp. CBHHK59/15]|nr:hypothetical protein B0H10DRAFT_2167613 [Mycena sp. CBHHK59/15]
MPNPTGKNGAGIKNYPPDKELKETLLKYVWQGLSQTTKLNEIERRLSIPSVCYTPVPKDIAAQAVADEADKDVTQRNGPDSVKSKLRDKLIMVKCKNKVYRQPLSALGQFHKVSSDGHEKLGQQPLKMGDVGLPIYTWKDNWTADLLKISVVLNCWKNTAISHLLLDFLEELGGILIGPSIQGENFAPDINLDVYPSHVCIKSVHNTIIEAFWWWLCQKLGINLQEFILRGKVEHVFDPNVLIHRDLFNWIFPPLIQAELNEFHTYWNQHKICDQPDKNMPSGHVPADVLEHPEIYGGINCLIKVPRDTLDDLRAFITEEVGP